MYYNCISVSCRAFFGHILSSYDVGRIFRSNFSVDHSIVIVLDAELFLHLAVVEDAEDVLAGAVDGAAQQEVGEAEVVVLASQDVITILKVD